MDAETVEPEPEPTESDAAAVEPADTGQQEDDSDPPTELIVLDDDLMTLMAHQDAQTQIIPRVVVPDRPRAPRISQSPLPAKYVAPQRLSPAAPQPTKQRRPPASGWRRRLYQLTAGLIDFGDSAQDRIRRDRTVRAGVPIQGDYRIAVLSLKGGVGKTTTTLALGATLAAARADRVIAVDANPDFGTLAQRGPDASSSTIRDLLADSNIKRYSDVTVHTSQTATRLEILASERDPSASDLFTALEYKRLIDVLHRYYNIIITDCGTGLVHSAARGVLTEANAVVLVTSQAADSVRSTAVTLDWLACHGYPTLARTATVVVSGSHPGVTAKDVAPLLSYFRQSARSVHFVPFDEHLAEGAEVFLHLMSRGTQDAYLGLAAALADGFPVNGRV